MNQDRHQPGLQLKTGLILLTALALAACGSSSSVAGGGNSGGSGGDPAGIYLGILENPAAGSSDAMWGLIDSRHQAVFIDQTAQAVYRFSSFSVSGNKFSGSLVTLAPATSGGTVHSSFAPADSLTGYIAFGDATVPAYSFSDSYQSALYNIPAAFSTIAGSYNFNNGSNITVASDGSFTVTYTGCTAKGSFTIPDPAHNAYELSGTQTCSATTLNITGLASYTPPGTVTSAQLTFEYDDGKSIAVEGAATK